MDPTQPVATGDADRVACEYLALRAAGSETEADRGAYRARLATEPERTAFDELVEGALFAESAVPRAEVPVNVLSGRYRLDEQLGAGGMGRVFAAFDTELERTVAVKILSAVHVGDPDREGLLQKESRLLATLQHPGIVAVHEAGRDGDLFYIVMDRIDGESLQTVIEVARRTRSRASTDSGSLKSGALLREAIGRPVPDGRTDLVDERSWSGSIGRIARELASTIEAAHGRSIVHRDLKPSNVMLIGGGHPVVLDFGLAGTIDHVEGAITRGLYGTAPYLAPEQAAEQKSGTDTRTDVYQLGLILYELLTLERAFPGDEIGPVLDKVRQGDFIRPRRKNPAIPRDLEAICLKALEHSPARRYANAGELRRDLDRFLEDDEVPEAVHSNTTRLIARRTRILSRRHPMLITAALFLLIALPVMWMLRGEPALEFVGFRAQADPATGNPVRVAQIDPTGAAVYDGDYLGVEIRGERESHVYALSFVRPAGGPALVKAMEPELFEEFVAGRTPRREGRWDLAVPAGIQRVLCTAIDASASEEGTSEGLYVYACFDPDPVIEAWLGRLEGLPASRGAGVPIGVAKSVLASVRDGAGQPGGPHSVGPDYTPRGSSLETITAAERERWRDVDLEPLETLETLRIPNAQLFVLECLVSRR